ncbi:SpoIIE family protein phosphatase [Streptomyces sp. MI02-7b]|uniref:SpoIIE family protein phosphatase n=1 Tax=Streptomyces sp. MI02-7b TaxID=462941 RepID=UPI0029C9DB0B|nr:SpoIIE family protein phosphatase [Streptomyces sp. MI02-7b]
MRRTADRRITGTGALGGREDDPGERVTGGPAAGHHWTSRFCGRCWTARRRAWASAGHLPPAPIRPDGSVELIRVPVGPPLGTGHGGYEIVSGRCGRGDVLLLNTDGLVERRGEDIDVSLERLARLRLPPDGDLGRPGRPDPVLVGLRARRGRHRGPRGTHRSLGRRRDASSGRRNTTGEIGAIPSR